MPLWWIVHEVRGKRLFWVQEGPSLVSARIHAALAGFEGGYVEGFQLDAPTANRVPRRMIGKVLSHAVARKIIEGMESE